MNLKGASDESWQSKPQWDQILSLTDVQHKIPKLFYKKRPGAYLALQYFIHHFETIDCDMETRILSSNQVNYSNNAENYYNLSWI